MIITKQYAKRLVKEGKATVTGHTTDQARWADREYGKTYAIITRHDKKRVDHCEDYDLDLKAE